MNVALRRPMTLDAFPAWEREQEQPWEFDGFEPVAMNGGTVAHSVIATNIAAALAARLKGTPCRAFRADLKTVVAGRVRYADAVVSCTPLANDADVFPEPVVVFEVLSPSTARTDRVAKNTEYQATPSIMHYVMLEQEAIAATVFSRDADARTGRLHGGETAIPLPAIGLDLPLAPLHDGLDLAPPKDD